jgi:hypothetical protein
LRKFRFFIQNYLKTGCLFYKTRPSAFCIHFIIFLLIANAVMFFALAVSAVNAESVTLVWDANEEPDLEGYVVYRNTESAGPPYAYSHEIPEQELVDPLHPQLQLTGLQEGKQYYIALTAYNTEGSESNFSKDICVEVVDSAVELCSQSAASGASTGSDSGGGGGGGFGSCFISTASTEASLLSRWIAAW